MQGFAVLFLALVAVSTVSSSPVGPCEQHGQLMADDTRCNVFYECSYGHPFLFYCQTGLEYNPEFKYCDYPKAGGCRAGTGNTGNTDNTVNQSSKDPKCPSQLGEDVVQFANPDSCSSFYKCDDKGVAVLIPCPANLQYNAELGVCDYANHAHCKVSKE